MTKAELPYDVFTYSLLHQVNEKIVSWNLDALTGQAIYAKHDSIAYVALKIYGGEPGDYTSKVIWNLPHHPIAYVYPDYKTDIERSLVFFLRHMAALRGESIRLTFEVNDATFDKTATRHHPLEKAAIYALVNCFDNDLLKAWNEQARVKTMKEIMARPDYGGAGL